LPQHFGYDFLNADMLRALKVEGKGQAVSPGGARYRVIMLGGTSRFMSLSVLRQLKALVAGGVPVVGKSRCAHRACPTIRANLPARLTLWSDPNIVASNDIEAAMVKLGISGLAGPCAFGVGLQFVHRILPDGDIYYVSNPGDQAVKADVAFRAGASMPQIWNARWPGHAGRLACGERQVRRHAISCAA
jgi:hypothetical protein